MSLGVHAPRSKACKVCQKPFMPARPLQSVCGPKCAGKLGKLTRAKERQETRERKQALKKLSELIAEAQVAFNAYIRARDRDKGCFVCNRPFIPGVPGRNMHAGHVRSRGAAGHLRFVEDNCLGECEGCNDPMWGAKPHEIKAGAIARIGEERFAELESDNEPRKWTREELIAIKETYRAKLREMKKQRKAA